MPGLSTKLKMGEYREVLFWLLLLGSWQFLASPGSKNGVGGAIGTAVFLLFACGNLDRSETPWAGLCTLEISDGHKLAVRNRERGHCRRHGLRDRICFGPKHEARRRLEA